MFRHDGHTCGERYRVRSEFEVGRVRIVPQHIDGSDTREAREGRLAWLATG